MKHTEYSNLVLVSSEDLNDTEAYRAQTIKERMYSESVGVDSNGSNAVYSGSGITKEPSDLRFSGTEGSPITNAQFTIGAGTAYTRFDPTSTATPQYVGGERINLSSSLAVTITNTAVAKYYIYLVYVELHKNKKFDESGAAVYFVDREESFLVVQMTQAQATTLNSFISNPNGSVSVSGINGSFLSSSFNNSDEKTATFGTSDLSNITFTVTHYNSVFLGEIQVTNSTGPVWQFYHTLPGGDPLLGTMFRSGFSAVDQFHRTELGRGTASTTNPHALIIQDLGNFNDNNVDHNNLDHSQGIIPKFTNSCECVIDGTPGGYDNVLITQINSGEYLFIQGKRITTLSNTTVSFSDLPATGVYYIYVQPSGSSTKINVYPWEYYSGTVSKGTTIPTDAYLLCSVYWNGSTAKAYNGDPRYSAGSVVNPVTDLRIFGLTGYDVLHNTILESVNKENLIPNGFMQISEKGKIKGWVTGTSAKIVPSSGSIALQIGAGVSDTSLLFPFDANVDHAFRVKLNSEGASATYNITLQLFRGKDRALDQIGTFTLKSTTATYSSWTLIESEFLSSSTITYSGALTDRNYIGWAAINISSNVALDVDDIVLRPKIKTLDISDSQVTTAKIADSNVTTAKILDSNVTSLKIPRSVKAIYKGHLDATTDTTTIESLVGGGNADALHNHSVGTANIVTIDTTIAYSVNIVLDAGTWVIEAVANTCLGDSGFSTGSVFLYINGIQVDKGDPAYGEGGSNFRTLFGKLQVAPTVSTPYPVAVSQTFAGVVAPHIYARATKIG